MADDYAGDASTTGVLPIGGTTSGTLETSGDKDWFAVSVIAGRNYEFDLAASMTATSVSALSESLINPAGVTIVGGFGNKTISYTPTASGTYFVAVANSNNGTGSYSLSATPFDDYTGDFSTTGMLPIGGTSGGVLESAGDKDAFLVTLTAGLNYQFTLGGAASATNVSSLAESLLNSNGVTIVGGFGNKSISYTPTSTGAYYLVVANSNNGIGAYTLAATPLDDYTGDFATLGRLAIGGSTNGVLESAGDKDNFAVSLTAGLNYQFTLAGAASATNISVLAESLVGSNGVTIVGGFGNKSISYTPTATGIYYLSVANSSGTGAYTLTSTPLDDYTGDFATAGRVVIGGTVGGVLESAGDRDDFAVSLTAGSRYQFILAGAASSTGITTLAESLIDANGVTIASGFGDKNISYTPTVSGTYYLAVANSGGSGAYTVGATGTPQVSPVTVTVPVYRFFDSNTGTQFLTSSAAERDTVNNTRPDLVYEGVGLNAAASNDPNASAVYRFFDTHYGTHFFTSSTSERDTVIATRSDLSYEGIGFYEDAAQQPNTSPVYRFFDSNRGTHFFTGSATEKATILSTRSDLVFEGVSFYSPNS